MKSRILCKFDLDQLASRVQLSVLQNSTHYPACRYLFARSLKLHRHP
jgi:hypothetical protein